MKKKDKKRILITLWCKECDRNLEEDAHIIVSHRGFVYCQGCAERAQP